jgi:hypothetical protein
MVGKFICQILLIDSPLTHHFPASYPAASFYMPHGHKTYLPTHRSLRIHQRRGVDEIWRRDVEEKEQIKEVRARVKDLSSLFSISPSLVDCCCCVNKQHATINRLNKQLRVIHTTNNTQQSTLGLTVVFLREKGELISCTLMSIYLITDMIVVISSNSAWQSIKVRLVVTIIHSQIQLEQNLHFFWLDAIEVLSKKVICL